MTEPGSPHINRHQGDISVYLTEVDDFKDDSQFSPDVTPATLHCAPGMLHNKKTTSQAPSSEAGPPTSAMSSVPQMPVFLPAQMMMNSLKQQEASPDAIRNYLQHQAAALEALKAQYAPQQRDLAPELEKLRIEINQLKGEKMQMEFYMRHMNVATATRLQQLEQVNLSLNDELQRLKQSAPSDETEQLRSRERELTLQLASKAEAVTRLERERTELKADLAYYKAKLDETQQQAETRKHSNDRSERSREAKLIAEVSALKSQLDDLQSDNVSHKQSKLYSENTKLRVKEEWINQTFEQKRLETSQQQSKDTQDSSHEYKKPPEQYAAKPVQDQEEPHRTKAPVRSYMNYSTNVTQVLNWEPIASSPEPEKPQTAPMTFPSLQHLANQQSVIESLEDKLAVLNQERQRLNSEYDRLEEHPKSQATIRRKEELALELSILTTNLNNIKTKLRNYQVLK